jgi:steroid 5-alpha reductase family enzyme
MKSFLSLAVFCSLAGRITVDGFVQLGQHARLPAVTVPSPRAAPTSSSQLKVVAMPIQIPIEVATCLLPTCGGYWSREFGVSFAYGAATSLTAGLVLKNQILATSTGWNWAAWHAAAIVFYGVRLSAFLLYRQMKSKRIQEMQKKIEERTESTGSRLARTPFALSCAYLYYGLCAPLYLTSAVMDQSLGKLQWAFKGLVGLTWLGFAVAALGDLHKSFAKGRKGESHLVTGGLFSLLRHPNYTGEMLGWTSSGLAGVLAFLTMKEYTQVKPWFHLGSTAIGVSGILFVLLLATRNLEKKQRKAYGDQDAYQKWISTSWGGWELAEKPSPPVKPHLEVTDTIEDSGSGI